VVIRSSSAGEVEGLLARLRRGSGTDREAAVARLRVLGARAVARLTALVTSLDESAAARSAALRALDGSTEARVRDAAVSALADDSVAPAAIATLRPWVMRGDGIGVLEALTTLALDAARPPDVRLAALDAVSQLPGDVVQPLMAAAPVSPAAAAIGAADDPLAAREWLDAHPAAPLSVLHDFVVEARERERHEPTARRRDDWRVTRGAAHAALARRGSRVALYDLKETFDAAGGPLPLDYLAAVTAIGDASCLEPMARAWAATPKDAWWRDRLTDAAAEIMRRHKLSGRSAAVRRIRTKFNGFL
jgi:hypothetical protein